MMSSLAKNRFSFVLILALICLLLPWENIAMAQAGSPPPSPSATCTSESIFDIDPVPGDDGIMTQIVSYLKDVLNDASERLFEGITGNASFQKAVSAAMILFITIYGVMFTFGIVPLRFADALIRLIKFAIIWALMTDGWAFFNEYAVKFFNDGTDDLINAVTTIAFGGDPTAPAAGDPSPFRYLDAVAAQVFSSKMLVALMGAFSTGPFGLLVGGLLGLSLGVFLMAFIQALYTYGLSLVAKALLFGIAPIIFVFLLFERTKNIFTGWVNQLIHFSLLPILLFAFFSFFIVLMQEAVDNILDVELCWEGFHAIEGSPENLEGWRFIPEDKDGNPIGTGATDWSWEGAISCLENNPGGDCPDFPLNFIDILAFLILSYIAWKFSDLVQMIAAELSSTALLADRLHFGGDTGNGGISKVSNLFGR